MWAITSYFNPQRYANRLENYRTFRARLGVPLVAVELAYGEAFELEGGDADILLQVRGGDILWQKERLLNLGLAALPAEVEKFAWLDCDGIFEQDDWAEQTSRLLDEYAVVQPFSQVQDLHRGLLPEPGSNGERGAIAPSLASRLAAGLPLREVLTTQFRQFHESGCKHRFLGVGNAWASRKSLVEQAGLYDGLIMGGGDSGIAIATCGDFELIRETALLRGAHLDHYLAWARSFHVAVGGSVGCASGMLYHLWHGDIPDRNYANRHRGFLDFEFDPTRDIALDADGCWKWNSDKPAMHQYVREYFFSRCEEGAVAS